MGAVDVGVRMIITDWLMGMEQDLACYQTPRQL